MNTQNKNVPTPGCWLVCSEQAMADIRAALPSDLSGLCRLGLEAGWINYVPLEHLREQMELRVLEDWSAVTVVIPEMTGPLAVSLVEGWTAQQRARIGCYQYKREQSAVLDALLVPDIAITTQWLLDGRPPQVSIGGEVMDSKWEDEYQQAFATYWKIVQDNYGEEAFDFPLPNDQVIWGLFSAKLPEVQQASASANDSLYTMAAASYGRLEGASRDEESQAPIYERHWVYPAEASQLEQDHLYLRVSHAGYGQLQLQVRTELSRERWQHAQPTQVEIFMPQSLGLPPLKLELISGGEHQYLLRQTHTSYDCQDKYNLHSAFYDEATLDQAHIQVRGQMLPYDEDESDDGTDLPTDDTGSDT